ncbi:hypothetical protein HH1059_15580 [Halorhodospira halochloris]|uniref:Uncharacterized protein n=1 Tax=Halorhodospira halochloris TaxID=1052 RepID=A0A2Z6EZM6_HALHR|nr:hypothetical protein HH1059_15580 [Halorhodospira halochloris]
MGGGGVANAWFSYQLSQQDPNRHMQQLDRDKQHHFTRFPDDAAK